MRTHSGLPGRGSVCPAGPRLRSRLAQTLDDRGVGHPAALTHLPVVPRARRRGLTPIRTPICSPCPSASTNKRAAQRVPASTQTCSAAIWGSSGRRFKSFQPDPVFSHVRAVSADRQKSKFITPGGVSSNADSNGCSVAQSTGQVVDCCPCCVVAGVPVDAPGDRRMGAQSLFVNTQRVRDRAVPT
jgi:hypothetical protein